MVLSLGEGGVGVSSLDGTGGGGDVRVRRGWYGAGTAGARRGVLRATSAFGATAAGRSAAPVEGSHRDGRSGVLLQCEHVRDEVGPSGNVN